MIFLSMDYGHGMPWNAEHMLVNLNLRGGTRKVGKQERNRRKNEGERAGKKHKVDSGKSDAAIFFPKI